MTVDKIVKQFTKTLTQLERLIENHTATQIDLSNRLDEVDTEKARAERIRNKLKEIVE